MFTILSAKKHILYWSIATDTDRKQQTCHHAALSLAECMLKGYDGETQKPRDIGGNSAVYDI